MSCPNPAVMALPVTVYLDTQDYSRLDDARAGRPRGSDLLVLERLLELKASGLVRFVYSAMNISELLRYDGGGRDLTLRKAGTLTFLAEHAAYLHPSRLIAYQMAEQLVVSGGLPNAVLRNGPISSRDEWFPLIPELIGDLRGRKRQVVEETIDGMGLNRKERRRLRSKGSKLRVSDMPESSFDALIKKYPFSPEVLTRVFPLMMDGLISRVDAERRLLDEMGDPERYVIWFFEIAEGDKSSHDWVKRGGEAVARSIRGLRERLEPYASLPEARPNLARIAKEYGVSIPKQIVERFPEELAEFGVDAELRAAALANEPFLRSIPFVRLWSSLLPEYLIQHSGFRQSTRAARESDGGDILHTLTLPYCDLWRGDAYFSDLVRQHAPPGSAEIVSRLEELPAAIERVAKWRAGP